MWKRIMLVFSLLALIIANLFLSTLNTKLQYNLQTKQEAVNELKKTNQELKDEINVLKNKERVLEIASYSGLVNNVENVLNLFN